MKFKTNKCYAMLSKKSLDVPFSVNRSTRAQLSLPVPFLFLAHAVYHDSDAKSTI